MANYTILVIDYDPRSAEQVTRTLRADGYDVEVAEDGIEGIEAFHRIRPDLTLIEAMIPKRHGFEVCQQLKQTEHGRRSAIVIMTAVYKGRKYRQDALHQYGCDEYLEKPFEDKVLLETVRRFCADGEAVATTVPETPADELPEPETPAEADVESGDDAPVDPVLAGEDRAEGEIMDRLDELMSAAPEAPAPEPVAAAAGPIELNELADEISREVEDLVLSEQREPEVTGAAENVETDLAGAAAEALADLDTDALFGEHGNGGEAGGPGDPASLGPDPLDEDSPFVIVEEPGSGNDVVRLVEQGAIEVDPPEDLPVPEAMPDPAMRSGRGVLPPWVWVLAAVGVAAGSIGFFTMRQPTAQAGLDPSSPPLLNAVTPAPHAAAPQDPFPRDIGGPPDAAIDGADEATPPTRERAPANVAGTGDGSRRPARPTPSPSKPAPTKTAKTKKPEPTKTAAPKTAVPEVKDLRTPEPEPATRKTATPQPVVRDRPAENAVPSSPLPAPPVEYEPAEPEPEAEAETPLVAVNVSEPVTPPPPALEPVLPSGPGPTEQPLYWKGMLLDLAEVDSPPVPVRRDPPDYPPMAQRAGRQGKVELKVLVDYTGNVLDVRLIRGVSSMLDHAAIDAVERWTYEPATKNGLPVKVWLIETVGFSL